MDAPPAPPCRSASEGSWDTAHPGEVAQLAEHAAENRGVGSSILPLATTEGSENANERVARLSRRLCRRTAPGAP
jgi:hypothetical protein